MSRPRLLDLFCGAGGAARGYQLAGFHVTGVDIEAQPNYCGDEFIQGDALEYLGWVLDEPTEWRHLHAIHASPPCQAYSKLRFLPTARKDHPDLLLPTIDLLRETGLPFVVENVEGNAPWPADLYRFRLCGSSFGLRTRRHRWFATNASMMARACQHDPSVDYVGVYGASDGEHGPGFKHPGVKRGPRQATLREAREVMGMPWAKRREELTQAIPPAYTEHIGGYLLAAVRARAAA